MDSDKRLDENTNEITASCEKQAPGTVKSESAFHQVESCGYYQVSHVFVIQLMRSAFVWALYLMVFGNYEPPWHCVRHDHGANGSSPIYDNGTDTLNQMISGLHHSFYSHEAASSNSTSTNSTHREDSIEDITNSSNSSGTKADDSFYQGTCAQLPTCDGVIFDPRSVTLVSEFGLICDKAFIPSIIFAVQMLGMLLGANAGGQLGDICGRKVSIYGSMALTSLATFIAVWSTSWEMYAALTFFIGLGGGGIVASLNVYAMEFLNPKWRGRFGAIPMWNISLLILAFVIIGLKVWWQIHIFCSVATALFLLCALWTPESMRWLHAHGKDEKVENAIKRIMKCNKKKEDVLEVLKKLKETEVSGKEIGRRYTYLDLFRTPDLRSMTIKVSIIWFSMNICYFTLGFSIKSLSGDYYINLLVSCTSEIPFILLLGPCINKLGRRITGSLFMSLTTVFIITCIVVHYVAPDPLAGTLIKYLAFVAKGCAIVGWSTMTIFSTELFPTVVRTLAMGFFNTAARLGGIVASTLIPRDDESTILCFFALAGVVFTASIIVMTLPETKNKPLLDRITNQEMDVEVQDAAPNTQTM